MPKKETVLTPTPTRVKGDESLMFSGIFMDLGKEIEVAGSTNKLLVRTVHH